MNRQKLIDAYATYFKLGYDIQFNSKTNLLFDPKTQSYWTPAKQLNILDTVVLLEENVTGNWFEDVSKVLETTPDFIRGFVLGLGFSITAEDTPS